MSCQACHYSQRIFRPVLNTQFLACYAKPLLVGAGLSPPLRSCQSLPFYSAQRIDRPVIVRPLQSCQSISVLSPTPPVATFLACRIVPFPDISFLAFPELGSPRLPRHFDNLLTYIESSPAHAAGVLGVWTALSNSNLLTNARQEVRDVLK